MTDSRAKFCEKCNLFHLDGEHIGIAVPADKRLELGPVFRQLVGDLDQQAQAVAGPGKIVIDVEYAPEEIRFPLAGDGVTIRQVVKATCPDATNSTETDELAKKVARKLEDPAGNPTMTIKEAAHAFIKSEGSIRRWIAEGKLKNSGKPGRILTTSVKQLLKTPPEKP